MNVLVTGANGFIGSVVCNVLEKNRHKVLKLISTKENKRKSILKDNVFEIDITDKLKVNSIKFAEKIDAVVHTAGLAHQFGDTLEEKFYKVNIEGTRNVTNLALKLNVEHFVQISSVSVYGNSNSSNKKNKLAINETDECNPLGKYAKSKYEAEKVCEKLFESSKANLTILRLATVIGNEDKGNVLRLIELIDSGKFIWVGHGNNKKSLIHKKDVATAILCILENKNSKESETFNITTKPWKMWEIVKVISDELPKKILPIKVPETLVISVLTLGTKFLKIKRLNSIKASLKKWTKEDVYSGSKFAEKYNFQPKISIKDALTEEVSWFKNKQSSKKK